jgi:2-polyprenyl-3-methyl-5-hydroxy-6-metoxy-1,4-benzoquinol methylase
MFEQVAAKRRCPLCASVQGRAIWHEVGYRFLRCTRCSVVFSDISESHYRDKRHNVWDDDVVTHWALDFYGRARERVHEAFLARRPPTGRLLDVGCGLGFFIERASRAGWDVLGCDPSEAWAREARKRVGRDRVVHGDADHPDVRKHRFDLITAWDVIEHVFEPVPFLVQLRELLAPDGAVFLRTPNLAYVWPLYGLRRSVLRHEVELGPTNHLVLYTRWTLARALRAGGFQPVDWINLPPPQIAIESTRGLGPAANERRSLALKNRFSEVAAQVSARSGGRVVLSSDLDVTSRAA